MLLAACSGNTSWSHDAGLPFDAGAAVVWVFPRSTTDAGRTDRSRVEATDGPPQSAWVVKRSLPRIEEYRGDQRHLAIVLNPDEQPCVVLSNEGGLYFGCLETLAHRDVGARHDASQISDGLMTPIEQWRLDRLREHPGNNWIGSDVDAVFDDQGRPWVVARQFPQRQTHLFHHDGQEWRHEEVPVALGGIDPQLHRIGGSIVLVHATDEHHEAPALVASRRLPDGTWNHRRLIDAYDAQPGRWHRSFVNGNQIDFCSFEPASQRVTWGRAHIDRQLLTDAGSVVDTSTPDAAANQLIRKQTFEGGPFCDVDELNLYYNQPLLGLVTKTSDQELPYSTSHRGPFVVMKTGERELILSARDRRLLLGQAHEAPHEVGLWTVNDRPKALAVGGALLIATESTQAEELEFTLWEPAP